MCPTCCYHARVAPLQVAQALESRAEDESDEGTEVESVDYDASEGWQTADEDGSGEDAGCPACGSDARRVRSRVVGAAHPLLTPKNMPTMWCRPRQALYDMHEEGTETDTGGMLVCKPRKDTRMVWHHLGCLHAGRA